MNAIVCPSSFGQTCDSGNSLQNQLKWLHLSYLAFLMPEATAKGHLLKPANVVTFEAMMTVGEARIFNQIPQEEKMG